MLLAILQLFIFFDSFAVFVKKSHVKWLILQYGGILKTWRLPYGDFFRNSNNTSVTSLLERADLGLVDHNDRLCIVYVVKSKKLKLNHDLVVNDLNPKIQVSLTKSFPLEK